MELSTDRPVGLDRGAIPFSSIVAYAARYGIDDLEEFERFLFLIRALDRVDLSHKPEQQDG